MTDLEMTKLCAEAMGMSVDPLVTPSGVLPIAIQGNVIVGAYDPLHDDVQAMALVKRFDLQIQPPWARANRDWRASPDEGAASHNADLNRAIVECVAKMQAEKVTA